MNRTKVSERISCKCTNKRSGPSHRPIFYKRQSKEAYQRGQYSYRIPPLHEFEHDMEHHVDKLDSVLKRTTNGIHHDEQKEWGLWLATSNLSKNESGSWQKQNGSKTKIISWAQHGLSVYHVIGTVSEDTCLLKAVGFFNYIIFI